ncbi:hypothetical protein C8Q72DRAFT_764134, partial [Fomitopsis betulina]
HLKVRLLGRIPFRLQFPPELWDQVIDELRDNPTSLRECSRACRAWLPTTRHHLSRRIKF